MTHEENTIHDVTLDTRFVNSRREVRRWPTYTTDPDDVVVDTHLLLTMASDGKIAFVKERVRPCKNERETAQFTHLGIIYLHTRDLM